MRRLHLQVTGRLAVLLLSAWLAGCGFHLRGALPPLPAALSSVQLGGVDERSELGAELLAALQQAGADTAARPPAALLQIDNEQVRRRMLSVGHGGRAAEYEITYGFDFSLQLREAQPADADTDTVLDLDADRRETYRPLLVQESIRLSRDYAFDADSVLGKGGEEEALLDEMRSLAVQQLVLRLRAAALAEGVGASAAGGGR